MTKKKPKIFRSMAEFDKEYYPDKIPRVVLPDDFVQSIDNIKDLCGCHLQDGDYQFIHDIVKYIKGRLTKTPEGWELSEAGADDA